MKTVLIIHCCGLSALLHREYRQKSNITFHNNNTVSYREYRRYYFYPDGSAGNESDEIVLPNMLVLVGMSYTLVLHMESS